MIDFKEFIDAVERGETRKDLYLMPDLSTIPSSMRRLMEELLDRGLLGHMLPMSGKVIAGLCEARFMVPYPKLVEWAKGATWTAMHGEGAVYEYVKKYPGIPAETILDELRACVR